MIKNFTGPLFHGKVIDFVDKYLGGWDNKLPEMYSEELKVRERKATSAFMLSLRALQTLLT